MFDLPGISGVAAANFPSSMGDLASWSTKLLDALYLERLDITGYSWSGALAQQTARDAPLRVRNLVLMSTNFGPGCAPCRR
jgi:pimeloyl-ACP methyl ester carboxylesterase